MEPIVQKTLADVQRFAAGLTEAALMVEHSPELQVKVVYNLLVEFEATLAARRRAIRSHWQENR